MSGEIKNKISEYFSENSPALVNFISYAEKNWSDQGFDSVLFYFLPEEYYNGIPYRIFFENQGRNVTHDVLEIKTYNTISKILSKLPPIFDRSGDVLLPEWIENNGTKQGREGFIFECCADELKCILGRLRISEPRFITQIHDSIYRVELSE